MQRIAVVVLAFAAIVTTLACGGGDSPTGPSGTSGNFNLRITDSPYGSAQAVLVTFSEVTVHTAGGDSKKVSLGSSGSSTLTCDLKKLENNAQDLLGTANLKAGDNFTMVRLKVEKARIFFGGSSSTSPTPCAASIPEPTGGQGFTLTIPSSEIKLIDRPFTQSTSTTTMLLDFDGGASVVDTGNQNYILTPVVRIVSVQ